MAELKKRERSANFSAKEVQILISFIKDHQSTIECKKTDCTTWKDKDQAWEKVTALFNSTSGEVFRTKKTLKAKYEDIKKTMKKKLAHNRMEQFKTGGGQPQLKALTNIEENILSIMPSCIEGLPSVWDCDQQSETETATNVLLPEIKENLPPVNENVNLNSPINPHEEFCDVEFLLDDEYNEVPVVESESNEDFQNKKKVIKETGVSILRKRTSPELRINKRLKQTHELKEYGNIERDRQMKEELHALRIQILKKELEIKESQALAELEINTEKLKAIKAETEMRIVQKQVQDAKLIKLKKDID